VKTEALKCLLALIWLETYFQVLGDCSANTQPKYTPHVLEWFPTAEPNFLLLHCWEQILGPSCQKHNRPC